MSKIRACHEQHETSVKRIKAKTLQQLQKLEENHQQLRQEVEGGVQGLNMRLIATGKTSKSLERDCRKVELVLWWEFLLLLRTFMLKQPAPNSPAPNSLVQIIPAVPSELRTCTWADFWGSGLAEGENQFESRLLNGERDIHRHGQAEGGESQTALGVFESHNTGAHAQSGQQDCQWAWRISFVQAEQQVATYLNQLPARVQTRVFMKSAKSSSCLYASLLLGNLAAYIKREHPRMLKSWLFW